MAKKIAKIIVLVLVLIAIGWGIRVLMATRSHGDGASAPEIITNIKK